MTQLHEGERISDVNDHLRLIEKKGGMMFGTDALLLAAFARARKDGRAAELGAGTGIVSMLCATRGKYRNIDAYELQSEYAELCDRNIALNGLCDRIRTVCTDIRDIKDRGGEYDTVFTNPPYMKPEGGKASTDPGRDRARHELNGDIGDFMAAASRMLKYGGTVAVVWRPDRLCDLMCAMRQAGLEPKKLTMVCGTVGAAPSMCLAEGKKGGAPSMRVTEPLILKQADGSDTPQMAQLLKNGIFPL